MPNSTDDLPNVIPLVWSSLFTAFIAAGAYISIPFIIVPLYLANFFVALAGLILGHRWGVFSLMLYLGLGALGLPVFANGAGGIAHFFSPTGGFLLGYIPAVFLIGLLRDPQGRSMIRNMVAVLAGFLALYAIGLPFLALIKNWSFIHIIGFMVPYLAADLIKAIFAVILAKIIFNRHPRLRGTY